PVHEVDEAVFFLDAPGRAAHQHVPERLGFTDAAERVAKGLVEQPVHASEGRRVSRLPVTVVLPAEGREYEPHHFTTWASRSPDRAWATLSRSRLAFAGTRSKSTVAV